MTIAPPACTDALDDAELAMAAAHGDRQAFAAIYDRYADRLYDFCAGMLRDGDAAADCVQDVFVDAATQLTMLRDPSRLRSWLYAIARHQALARIRARRRELPSDELPEIDSGDPDMATVVARAELAALIAEACGALSERDRTVFELTYRHGLDGGELAQALGVSHSNANTLAGRLRDGVERSLGALLVCRGAKADPTTCAELAAIVDGWDGTFTVLMRKRAARHIDACSVCDAERRRRVNPVALLGGAPVFLPAPAYLRDQTLTATSSALPAPSAAPGITARQTRHARAALIAVFLLLGIAGVAQLATPLRAQDYRVDPVTELEDATSELPGGVSALTAPSSAPPSAPTTSATTGASEPAPSLTTTAITNAPTATTEPTPPTARIPGGPTTRPNSSFTPSRNPETSAMRTTSSSTLTSTPTSSSTSTSTSPSTVTSTSTTTTSSEPIE